uniref:Telomere repeat-binding factor like-protein n=1 Tax=Rehmannia glutinosa TaxID=99300 RepID=A0A0K1SBH8_REHGL|nr:telomere repeat-binding factor like-protein [Rehmannia glutinosa]
MVSKKRLDYGFNGYRAPVIPRAPRSIRRRGAHKNSVEDSKLCAFELLAAVAGKLLQESESSASSNVAEGKEKLGISIDGNEKGQPIDDKAFNSESFDHGSCAESAFIPEISIQEHNLLSSFKGLPQSENDSILEHTSEPASSDVLKNIDCDIKLGDGDVKNANGNPNCKVGHSICVGDSFNCKVESGPEMRLEDEKYQIGELSMAKTTSVVKDPNEQCVNSNMLINSDSSVQLPLYREPIPDALVQKHLNNVKLGIRDDDDNSYGCNKSSTKIRPFKPQPRMGNRRIRKMLTSKYRKVAPKLKGCELYNTSEGMKSFYQYRKRIYTRERFQQAPFKKRKLSDHRFSVAYDQDTSCDSISNLPEKGTKIDKSSSAVNVERANGKVKVHQKPKDPHVKFSIKSFKVPELYIELAETASVGSLKRAVMEAVTTILGSGIRVGVVLQGKKVRDDNRTLQQAGISEGSNLDTLGFTLEPCLTHVSPSKTAKKPSSVLPCEEDQELLRSPATPMIDSVISNASVDPPLVTKCDADVDNNGFISSPQTPSNELMDGSVPESNALVAVPSMNVGPLAVVPVNPKSKRSELSQRRIRRPFSVAEVEALVGAVEKLGTGRWRDVKIGAFENADHRTYVDLKDKWKTLVHTASISPHQRRGEPVPQELLDRVLSAHSYWSQHQSKQDGKHSVKPLMKTADPHEETVGA